MDATPTDSYPFYRDNDSAQRCDTIAHFLTNNSDLFGRPSKSIVVITGDLTDGGGKEDYSLASGFISTLQRAGFDVYAVPGNHDYCWKGVLALRDTLVTVRTAAIAAAAVAGAAVVIGGPAAVAAAAEGAAAGVIAEALAVAGLSLPFDFVLGIAGLVIAFDWDDSDNDTLRGRYIKYIAGVENPTQPAPGISPTEYPRFVDCETGRLILLDSMQDELDQRDGNRDGEAQVRLGDLQLKALTKLVSDYQSQRAAGKALIVCLHHSPLHCNNDDVGWNGRLDDFDQLLGCISGNVDCLLFGHTGAFQQTYETEQVNCPIPLINSENLENVDDENGEAYPITVLDLGTYRRLVFYMNDPSNPTASWGTL